MLHPSAKITLPITYNQTPMTNLKRYSRNIALSQIGQSGQELLLDSSVLVIGAGGLGSPVILYLASAGVGTIGIVDSDRVELSNLQRQILFGENSLGKPKVDEALLRVKELNPDIKVNIYKMRFTIESHKDGKRKRENNNISETSYFLDSHFPTFQNYDIIADCSDNFTTRFLINEACIKSRKTLVSGAVTGFTGQVSTFKAHLGDAHPCYRCFCPEIPPEDLLPNCSSGGVLGSVAGVIGSIQATEIIKELLEIGTSLSGNILIYDGIKANVRKVKLNKNKECKLCRDINATI